MNKTIIRALLFNMFLVLGLWVAVMLIGPKTALLQMERFPYNQGVLKLSTLVFSSVLWLDPDNALANVGMSEAILDYGYSSGSRFERDNYDPDAIKLAYTYAQRATEHNASNSRSFAQLAKLQIIQRDYRTAWSTLNRAYELDKDSYYAWYFLVVLNNYYQLYDKADHYAQRAMELAQFTFQHRRVIEERIRIARARQDANQQDELYRAIITLDPDRAYSYGNYAGFLYDQERYAEAVDYYKKALAISPYPMAQRMLKKAEAQMNGQLPDDAGVP